MKLLLFIILFVSFAAYCSAQYNKYGSRFIRNYEVDNDSVIVNQMINVHKDSRGVLFLSQAECLIEYDGTSFQYDRNIWQPTLVKSDPQDGTLYIANGNDFGYIEYNSYGKGSFHSLKSLIDDDSYFLDDGIHFKGDSVFFFGRNAIIVYDKSSNTVSRWCNGTPFNRGVLFENNVYVSDNKMVYTADSDSLHPYIDVANSFPLLDMRRIKDNETLLSISNRLVVTNDEDGSYRDIRLGDFSDKLGNSGQYDKIVKVNDDLFALASRGSSEVAAVALFDSDYNPTEYINVYSGYADKSDSHLEYDSVQHKIWGTHSTFSSINMSSPIRVLYDATSINGTMTCMGTAVNGLFFGTTQGINYRSQDDNNFYSVKALPSGELGSVYSSATFVSPYDHKRRSVIVADAGLYTLEDSKVICMNEEPVNYVIQDPYDLKTIYAATFNVVFVYTLQPDLTLKEVKKAQLNNDMYFERIWVTKDKILWLECRDDTQLTRYNVASNKWSTFELPERSARFMLDGEIVYVTEENQLFRFNTEKGDFDLSETTRFENGGELIFVKPYGEGYFVVTNDTFGFYAKSEEDSSLYEFIQMPTCQLCDKSIVDIYADEADSTIYFFSNKNIYSYRTDPQFHKLREGVKALTTYDYNALVRHVSSSDSTIFYGTFIDENGHVSLHQCKKYILSIPYNSASLTFNYTATCYDMEEKTQFSYFLDGYSDQWSEWSTSRTTNFTNLWEGTYTFRVKAKNIFGTESSVGEYTFRVLPPFYRSIWAYLIYAVLACILIKVIVDLYSKKLKRENERLEELVDERTEIIRQRDNEILSNINYASYIQHAALTPKDKLSIIFPEHFIMYRPHSIVSGDFYIVTSFGTKKICIVGDCTGHGVSGGFLSMLGMSFFRQIVASTQTPSEILQEMRSHIIENLHQGSETVHNQDGMDASVYVIDTMTNTLEFAGANSRLLIVHEGVLVELKGDKMPVSTHFVHGDNEYTNNTFQLSTGDMIYTFSDGYIDQFGGPDNKKFKMSRFRELILSIADKELDEQSEIVNKTFDEFKGERPQTDDVVVMGVRV